MFRKCVEVSNIRQHFGWKNQLVNLGQVMMRVCSALVETFKSYLVVPKGDGEMLGVNKEKGCGWPFQR